MAYETYTTEAIVCGARNRNTADRSYLLFTREAGMLFADARSVREERSRQRYALQEFSLLRVSLVRGKYNWKIGSIEPSENYYQRAADKEARGSVVNTIRLLRRFMNGEQSDYGLFDYLRTTLETVVTDLPERSFVELTTSVHILGHLGYVDMAQIPSHLFRLSPAQLSQHASDATRPILERLYAHAVTVSQL